MTIGDPHLCVGYAIMVWCTMRAIAAVVSLALSISISIAVIVFRSWFAPCYRGVSLRIPYSKPHSLKDN